MIFLYIFIAATLCFGQSEVYKAIGWSAGSGVSLGLHESYTFGYQHDAWMPSPMRDWYRWRPQTDAVFGKSLTFQKVFRGLDYATDRAAWEKWKKVFKVKEFLSWENLGAFVSHFTVKNTFATLVRDKMKHNKWFYSFEAELIFGDVIYDLIK
mgnify:FL=1